MSRDLILAKVATMDRCLARIRGLSDGETLPVDLNTQDIFVINLQRAVQSATDVAAHLVAAKDLGLASTLKENFRFLEESGILSADLSRKMMAMVGFRNIAVHNYQDLNQNVLQSIFSHHLVDLEKFVSVALQLVSAEHRAQ